MLSQLTQSVWTQKHTYIAAIALAIAGLVGAGWFGYSWYARSKEQAAYKDLAESIDAYNKARLSGSEKLTDVERGFAEGAKRNASSKLRSYFLVYQADALLELGKQHEAIALYDQALGSIARSNPLYFLYAVKRALIKLDATDDVIRKQGRQELTMLAHDAANPMQDMARYYSGLDALDQGDTSTAENYLKEISQQSSYWYQKAQDKLSEL